MKILLVICLTALEVKGYSIYSESCITDSRACLRTYPDFLGSYNDTNKIGCQERCDLVSNCEYWTWWGNINKCELFSDCTTDSNEDCIQSHCETGLRSCGQVDKFVSIISGGLNKQAEIQTQEAVTVVSETGICKIPDMMNSMAIMPRHRWGHVSTFIESAFIVCGGSTEQYGDRAPNDTCDIFDFANYEWNEMESMYENRHQAAGIGMLGKFYVTGGIDANNNPLATMEIYDPSSRLWTLGPNMSNPLSGHCVVRFMDSFIVIGGSVLEASAENEGVETSDIFLFNITTNVWSNIGNLGTPRTGHGCSINEKEEIIVTGGISSNRSLKTAEKITFTKSNTVVSKPFVDMPVRICHHAQTDNNQIQVFGGKVSNVGRNFVIEYETPDWMMTNVTLPQNLAYHHVTQYPANYVHCS